MRKAPDATFGTPKSLQVQCFDHRVIIRGIIANNGADLARNANKYLAKTVGIYRPSSQSQKILPVLQAHGRGARRYGVQTFYTWDVSKGLTTN